MEVNLTVANFEQEVVKSQQPVLVDFWAPWCGPCRMIAPYLAEIAQENSGKIKVCKLNVDEAPEVATRFAIMSIPALMIFKGGKIMEKRVGAMGKVELQKFVNLHIT